MSQKQTIVWTALPYGLSGGQARLSVLVSPRLECSDPYPVLGQFGDFENWPKTLAEVEFYAHIPGLVQSVHLHKQFKLDPVLWKRIFPSNTFVRPFQFTDLKDHVLRTFPVRATLDFLKSNYIDWANTCPGVPPNAEINELKQIGLDNLIFNLGQISENPIEVGSDLETQLANNCVLLPGSLGPMKDFYQAHAFYNRPSAQSPYFETPDAQFVPPRPDLPEFDFHDGLAMLADHPMLMRWLGLVLDFLLPLPPGPHGVIRVEPKWKSAAYNEDLTPFTHYRRAGDQFLADWTDNSDLRDGFLDLEGASDDF